MNTNKFINELVYKLINLRFNSIVIERKDVEPVNSIVDIASHEWIGFSHWVIFFSAIHFIEDIGENCQVFIIFGISFANLIHDMVRVERTFWKIMILIWCHTDNILL